MVVGIVGGDGGKMIIDDEDMPYSHQYIKF